MNRKTDDLKMKLLREHYAYRHGYLSPLLAVLYFHKLYLPCVEVPITTCCTMRCRDCSNLIQYYDKPYHVPLRRLKEDLSLLCKAVDGIDCMRILGGEPFLHPDLGMLLRNLDREGKISNIVIVTNGTLLLDESTAEFLSGRKNLKINISRYRWADLKRQELLRQLDYYGIPYSVKDVVWKDKASVLYRNRTEKELCFTFRECPNRFFSLLNGRLFLCPRSSHGTDLKIIPENDRDYVDLASGTDKNGCTVRDKIEVLLRVPYTEACNYCDEGRCDYLRTVECAVQIRKKDSMEKLDKMIRINEQLRRKQR